MHIGKIFHITGVLANCGGNIGALLTFTGIILSKRSLYSIARALKEAMPQSLLPYTKKIYDEML
jgi:hypothetical protein